MATYPQFDAACTALRQTLKLHKKGVPRTNADGSLHNGGVLYSSLFLPDPAAAGPSSLARSVRTSADALSLGLDALRVVLQHACQADCEMLSARPDCPDQCYAVTCDVDSFNVYPRRGPEVYRDIYSPALTTKKEALRLAEKKALDAVTDRHPFDGSTPPTFIVAAYDLDGAIEDAETFLDLRALAALRVVVGPDDSFSKMFGKVVKLRETKMPRTLYAEVPSRDPYYLGGGFRFSDLRVDKCGAPPSGSEVYPAEVLQAAAMVYVKHKKARKRAKHYRETPPTIPLDLTMYVNATVDKSFDTTVAYDEMRNIAGYPAIRFVNVAIRHFGLAVTGCIESCGKTYENSSLVMAHWIDKTELVKLGTSPPPRMRAGVKTLREHAKYPDGRYWTFPGPAPTSPVLLRTL